MTEVVCPITLNPDIAGAGVRVAIYLQTTLSLILGWLLPEVLLENTIFTLFNAGSLLVAALAQIKSGDISILDARVLFQLSVAPLSMAMHHAVFLWHYDMVLESRNELNRRYCLARLAGLILGVAYFTLCFNGFWVLS
ncbi:unnamed protein product [Rhizoctonia solani]|uniref:Uncharacterized protein n=1 Tax=Rhizoctonia solani TaxID=456999 RepID=A0A8H2XJV2_9AGAM|nr:unnamed protein product [Rhizoctonia solani]